MSSIISSTVSPEARGGPDAGIIENYKARLQALGYSPSLIGKCIRTVFHLIAWLSANGTGVEALDTLGRTDLLETLRQQQAASDGCFLRRFQYHGIADCECECQSARRQQERKVPWGDNRHHTEGSPHDQADLAVLRGQRHSGRLIRGSSRVSIDSGRVTRLEHRLSDPGSRLIDQRFGERLLSLLDDVGNIEQHLGSLGVGEARPGLSRFGGCFDRCSRFLCPGVGGCCENGLLGRIEDFERLRSA